MTHSSVTQPAPEFSYPLDVDQIPSAGGHYEIAASAQARTALAGRLGVTAVENLTAVFDVKMKAGDLIGVRGRVHADLMQSCVVTLVPVKAVIDEPVEGTFITEDRVAKSRSRKADADEDAEEVIGLDGDEPPEVAAGGRIDLGEFAVTQIALLVDPYPRAPGVSFDAAAWGAEAGAERAPSPFSVLEKLKKSPPE